MSHFDIIVAHTFNGSFTIDDNRNPIGIFGIGSNGTLPWHISDDLKHFKELTTETSCESKCNVVIMGRKTWESIPLQYRPLNNRINIIVTSTPEKYQSNKSYDIAVFVKSFELALERCTKLNKIENIYLIGGGTLYNKALNDTRLRYIYATIIDKSIKTCDTYIEDYTNNGFYNTKCIKQLTMDQGSGICYKINKYQRPNNCEIGYLNLCNKTLTDGLLKQNRTGIDTNSLFSEKLEFDLSSSFPLLTSKKMYWKGVVHELLWFLRGSTDVTELQEHSIHIWDQNSTREYLDQRNLTHLDENDIGPGYGFCWRHFGGVYQDCKTNYKSEGIDQIKNVINLIKSDPDSRRLIVTAWNPLETDNTALPPCHVMFQFYVDTNKKELSCQMYQRSADLFLGVPFNIASYALLVYMIAWITNLKPGKLSMVFGDAHVYENHVEQMKLQIQRRPRHFPQLEIIRDPETISDISEFKYEDFKIIGYDPHPLIKGVMAT